MLKKDITPIRKMLMICAFKFKSSRKQTIIRDTIIMEVNAVAMITDMNPKQSFYLVYKKNKLMEKLISLQKIIQRK
jgi:hypothetical protein